MNRRRFPRLNIRVHGLLEHESRHEPPINGDGDGHSHPGRFSSIRLTSFALTRPAGRYRGLRTVGPIFRNDLGATAPTHAKKAHLL